MGLTTLLVDDEPLALAGLRMLLAREPDISAIVEAKNGRAAVEIIRAQPLDLVFLDVQMPELDGFAVVKEIGADKMPPVIFVTAHDQYAIRAFEINAMDYLLKPVTEARFTQALVRARARLQLRESDSANRRILSLLETIAAPPSYVKRLAVRTAGKTIFVDIEDVAWIEAAENYVQLHAGRAAHLVHVGLTALEKSLDPERFLRVHRSLVVNIGHITELQPASHGEYIITLAGGTQLQSGRAYSDKIKALLSNPF
jgi:two-component system LytT family response regulator